MKIADCLF